MNGDRLTRPSGLGGRGRGRSDPAGGVSGLVGPVAQLSLQEKQRLKGRRSQSPGTFTGIRWQHEMTERQVPEAVMLEQQVVPEDVQEFNFLMSNCESPGKFYVHPLMELTARLANLEEDLVSGLTWQKQVQPGHSLPLIVGGVFAVLHTEDHLWYRVRLEGVTSGLATLRSIDYGFLLTSVSPSELRALPSGLSRQLPGLAVCCHLAHLTPVGGGDWTREAGEELRSLVDIAAIHIAKVVPGTEPSLGVLVSKKESEVQVNQQLVDCGVAESLFLVKKETREFSWDPMREDFKTTANNYLTNDDDLEIATCGEKLDPASVAGKWETEEEVKEDTDLDTNSNVTKAESLLNFKGGKRFESSEVESDPVKLAHRKKQLDYYKRTRDYKRYLERVPKTERSPEMPKTPNMNRKHSRRQWDGAVKHWKTQVKHWKTQVHSEGRNSFDRITQSGPQYKEGASEGNNEEKENRGGSSDLSDIVEKYEN